MDNKFEAYKQLRDSAIGKDLLEWMDAEYTRKIAEAVKSPQDEAYGLLRCAYGIMLVKQHVDSMASKKNS